jgi:Ca2+-binding RTX toxin-like protein
MIDIDNVEPQIFVSGSTTVSNGVDLVLKLGSVTDPGDDAITAYTVDWGDGTEQQFVVADDGLPEGREVTHRYADAPRQRTIHVHLEDEDGTHVDAATRDVFVKATPVMVHTDDAIVVVDEGQPASNAGSFGHQHSAPVTLTASLGDVVDEGNGRWSWSYVSADDEQIVAYDWDLNYDGTEFDADETGAQPSVTFEDDVPQRMIALRVTDSEGAWTIATTTLEIANMDPELGVVDNSAALCGEALQGDKVEISAPFEDEGILDEHEAVFDWGDGSDPEPAIVVEADGEGTLSGAHVYPDAGIYEVTITLTDGDGGVAFTTTTVVVTGASVDDGTLRLIGTADSDHILMTRAGKHSLLVWANFFPQFWRARRFDTREFEDIHAVLCSGSDVMLIAGKVAQSAIVDGGPGNDRITGGNGNDILKGGEGRDFLMGGGGRNILLGGLGEDRLLGSSRDDILIAGTTKYDANDDALRAILDEWVSEREYAIRIANLRGTANEFFDDRRNGDYFLIAQGDDVTVFDDTSPDVLIGSGGLDWFFANLEDDDELRLDRVIGWKKKTEVVEELSWIKDA